MLICCTHVDQAEHETRSARLAASWQRDWEADGATVTCRYEVGRGFVITAFKPLAVVWLNNGSAEDLQKARDWAAVEGWDVWSSVGYHENPLQWARDQAIAKATAT